MSKRPIYLDHHATTPADPRVVEAMLPFFGERFGNAASRTHAFGWDAEKAVEDARRRVASAVGGHEVVFTSGATEAINLAIRGAFEAELARGGKRRRIVTQVTEHKAVLDAADGLVARGAEVVLVAVDRHGVIDVDELAEAVDDGTLLVTVMYANNEIGTIQPIRAVAERCRAAGVTLHVDGAQAVGRIPVDLESDGIDWLSLSGHKVYGPKGVGALVLRRGAPRPAPQMLGGGHEGGLRSGTLNVPGIIGLARALDLCLEERDTEAVRLAGLRDRLSTLITDATSNAVVNGNATNRLPNNLNIAFPGVEGEALLMSLKDDVAVSSGSACTSAVVEPSHVLRAIGLRPDLAMSSLRFGLGRRTTDQDVEEAAEAVIREVRRLKRLR